MARKTTPKSSKPTTPVSDKRSPKSPSKPKRPSAGPVPVTVTAPPGGSDAARTDAPGIPPAAARTTVPAAAGRKRTGTAKGAKPAGGLAAAHQVLTAAKEPMRIRDITKAAMDKGLWQPKGQTPWSTLAAAIGREIKYKGKQSRFKKTDRGLFAASGDKA